MTARTENWDGLSQKLGRNCQILLLSCHRKWDILVSHIYRSLSGAHPTMFPSINLVENQLKSKLDSMRDFLLFRSNPLPKDGGATLGSQRPQHGASPSLFQFTLGGVV